MLLRRYYGGTHETVAQHVPSRRRSCALDRRPESFEIRFSLAVALQSTGQPVEAVSQYREVLRQQPKAVNAANNLAWILATHNDGQVRDSAEALRLARRVAKLTGARQPSALDTLAAALAAAGEFSEAVRVAEKALQLARTQKQTQLADKIESRLQLYRHSQPYREPL